MTGPLGDVWVYLSATPLLWLTATLVAYLIGVTLFGRLGRNPVVQPVAVAIVLLVAVLLVSGTAYDVYFDGAQFVHFLLGPATVALAVPLFSQWKRVKRAVLPMAAALLAGSLTAVVSAVGIAAMLGASRESVLSLAPKSVTTPIAMGIAEKIGGLPSLTAVLVILTGIIGAMTATPLLNLLGLKDYAARGFAVGVASHGIGTARAFQVSELAGAFAGIAMGLNALATAVIVPLLVRLFG
ncbi:LrgB family protein [Microbaculum marinisediminis]|uniref:LrgB family protein n=1 Tax=Microbaculum marinisediminis TaxID=2931392 RepID=A0AAW5QWJ6_9HYPH|nr:LrgB family protein [Microbaculum sp. A6E488]MCT8972093.1 LrgB family protein [Microbaculum sp. A6E488]